MKKYYIEKDYENEVEIPESLRKQIVADHLEKYYIFAITVGSFIIGFLLGVLAYAL